MNEAIDKSRQKIVNVSIGWQTLNIPYDVFLQSTQFIFLDCDGNFETNRMILNSILGQLSTT